MPKTVKSPLTTKLPDTLRLLSILVAPDIFSVLAIVTGPCNTVWPETSSEELIVVLPETFKLLANVVIPATLNVLSIVTATEILGLNGAYVLKLISLA